MIKGNLVDIAEKTLTAKMVSNANEGKISFCYLYESGMSLPLEYRVVSNMPEFQKHFEFIAVTDPTPLTLKQFQLDKVPVLFGTIPSDVDSPLSKDGGQNI